jgi:hypothetical protein
MPQYRGGAPRDRRLRPINLEQFSPKLKSSQSPSDPARAGVDLLVGPGGKAQKQPVLDGPSDEVVGNALAYWAIAMVNRSLPAATTSQGLLATPVVGTLCAAIVLGEPIGPTLLCAMALIVSGIALGTMARSPSRRGAASAMKTSRHPPPSASVAPPREPAVRSVRDGAT